MADRAIDIYVKIIAFVLQANYKHVDYNRFKDYLDSMKRIHPSLNKFEVKKGFIIKSEMADDFDSYRALSILLNYIYREMADSLGQDEAKRRIVKIAIRLIKKDLDTLKKARIERFVPAFMKHDIVTLLGTGTELRKIEDLKYKLTAIPATTTPESIKRMQEVKAPVYESKLSKRESVYIVTEHEEPLYVEKIAELKQKLKALESVTVKPEVKKIEKPKEVDVKGRVSVPKFVPSPERYERSIEKVRRHERRLEGARVMVEYKPHEGIGIQRFLPVAMVFIILISAIILYAIWHAPKTIETRALHIPKVVPTAKITSNDYVFLDIDCGAEATLYITCERYGEGNLWDNYHITSVKSDTNGIAMVKVPLHSGLNRFTVSAKNENGEVYKSNYIDVIKTGKTTRTFTLTAVSTTNNGSLYVYIDRVAIAKLDVRTTIARYQFSWPLDAGNHRFHLYWKGSGNVQIMNLEETHGILFVGKDRMGSLISGETITQIFEFETSESSLSIVPENGVIGQNTALMFDFRITDEERSMHLISIDCGTINSKAYMEVWVDNMYVDSLYITTNKTYLVSIPVFLAKGEHKVMIFVNTGLINQATEKSDVYLWAIRIGDSTVIIPKDLDFNGGEGIEGLDSNDIYKGDYLITGYGVLQGTFTL